MSFKGPQNYKDTIVCVRVCVYRSDWTQPEPADCAGTSMSSPSPQHREDKSEQQGLSLGGGLN